MKRSRSIWIDLDNSPHVPFFVPIIAELERRGYSILLTARDCFQVRGLADYFKLRPAVIGRHYGANKLLKVVGTVIRAMQLVPLMRRERPLLSLSHGSRSLILASATAQIPTILLFDYEHAKSLPFIKPLLGLAPEAISSPELSRKFVRGLRNYRGLKEDVYVSTYMPDSATIRELGLDSDDLIATIRPPATEAHYHNSESERLFLEVVNYLGGIPDMRMVLLPRNEITQRNLITETWPEWCRSGKIVLPPRAVNGLDLVWYSDLVVSGGGTMNREAAALGVPVYSIFRGRIGAVDRYLAARNQLVLIESVEDVRAKIRPTRRKKSAAVDFSNRKALPDIIDAITQVAATLR